MADAYSPMPAASQGAASEPLSLSPRSLGEGIVSMRNVLAIMILATVFAASACDGPRENAGEKADAAAGNVSGEDSLLSGPAEKLGAAQDAAADSRADAMEAEADSLEASAAEASEAAKQRAKTLRSEADAGRNAPAAGNGI